MSLANDIKEMVKDLEQDKDYGFEYCLIEDIDYKALTFLTKGKSLYVVAETTEEDEETFIDLRVGFLEGDTYSQVITGSEDFITPYFDKDGELAFDIEYDVKSTEDFDYFVDDIKNTIQDLIREGYVMLGGSLIKLSDFSTWYILDTLYRKHNVKTHYDFYNYEPDILEPIEACIEDKTIENVSFEIDIETDAWQVFDNYATISIFIESKTPRLYEELDESQYWEIINILSANKIKCTTEVFLNENSVKKETLNESRKTRPNKSLKENRRFLRKKNY